jgi:FKBP-type peptidyl-prolyl cis-trans isomerase
MVSKFEAIGIGISIAIMAVALYLLSIETTLVDLNERPKQTANVIVAGTDTRDTETALRQSMNLRGEVERLVIEDVVVGTGAAVKAGDTVTVDYVGRLPSGVEFDNSQKRGEPFTFTVGEGRVIAGWEEGIIGMKKGGQRILVVPPTLAYGERSVGPIPANATLVFSIELISIK